MLRSWHGRHCYPTPGPAARQSDGSDLEARSDPARRKFDGSPLSVVAPQSAFPNHKYPPSHSGKRGPLRCVAEAIDLKFCSPKVDSGFGRIGEPAFGMTVPKTAMNKDRSTVLSENQVRSSRQLRMMNSKSKSQPVESASQGDLGLGIRSSNSSHVLATCSPGQAICHHLSSEGRWSALCLRLRARAAVGLHYQLDETAEYDSRQRDSCRGTFECEQPLAL